MMQRKSQGIIKFIAIHPEHKIHVYTKFLGNPIFAETFHSKPTNVNLIHVLVEESGGHHSLGHFIWECLSKNLFQFAK